MRRAEKIARERVSWLLPLAGETRLIDLLGHAWMQGMRDAKEVAPAVDAVPAGDVGKMVETLRGEMAAEPKRDWYPVHRDYLDAILTAALSHGEGRK